MDPDLLTLGNGPLRLEIARSLGPRILGLHFEGSSNLLADLPGFVTLRPDGKPYHFYGGHRLWRAPEDPLLTYEPEDDPVQITPLEHGLRITRPAGAESGLEKSIEVVLPDQRARAVLTHTLKNCGGQAVRCAPWAITQFRTGGTAILPMSGVDTGFLPNRSLVLWSYTDLSDRNLHLGRQYIRVDATVEAPFKIGFSNPVGWLAYWWEGVLFVKSAGYDPHGEYPDFGCSSECYCNSRFLELETLGPLVTLQPGESLRHVETWSLFHVPSRPETEDDAQRLVEV